MKKKVIAVFLAGVFLAGCMVGCASTSKDEEEKSEMSMFAMDTYMSVTAYGEGADKATKGAKKEIEKLENLWSVTREDSDIYKVNQNAGNMTAVHEETADILSFALDMCEKTGGALDITIYPILSEWGFTTDKQHVPKESRIQELLKNTGYEKVTLDGTNVMVPQGVQLDLGAVGKGYTADILSEQMKKEGIESGLIDLGGNIKLIGKKPDGSEWNIGIKDPDGEGNIGLLETEDVSVVTSGGYERYFEENGERYWHILDPDTGKPAKSGLSSVTIISPESKVCDALSTAVFVMGLEKAEKFWREHQNLDFDMLLMTDEKEIYITENLKKDFKLEEKYKDKKLHIIKNTRSE
nr:FAD:protein FMN transferase [uncultured Sellimonas sp.]